MGGGGGCNKTDGEFKKRNGEARKGDLRVVCF